MSAGLSKADAERQAKALGINLEAVGGLTWWHKAILVELEHGSLLSKQSCNQTNVTHDDLLTTARIALAHLVEYPDYYQRLERLEQEARVHWAGRARPPLFLLQ